VGLIDLCQEPDRTDDRVSDSLLVADFDYELPPELIAQHPLLDRDASRLLVADPNQQTMTHRSFRDIGEFLRPGDVLVFNNSKVLPARLYGYKQDTGANVEFLLTKRLGPYDWEAMAKPAKRLKVGSVVLFPDNTGMSGSDGKSSDVPDPRGGSSGLSGSVASATGAPVPADNTSTGTVGKAIVTGVGDDGLRTVHFEIETSMEEFLHRIGQMPLPPYIHEPLKEADRYQTVYAKPEGSVAAPTAGLHFTEPLLAKLREAGVELYFVTLHVGIGTFRPVTAQRVEDHHMHAETYLVEPDVADAINKAKAEGRRVIAVGTTALRTLESAHQNGVLMAGTGDTDIFIYPGYRFQVIDALLTNFHLPKSTLLMLVSALMGTEFTRRVYAEAVRQRYRFFSFGDAMFITGRRDVPDDTTDSI
jgi:S-adenosylmethionine:tRNA ribosyltransferase-isomerase